MESLRSYLNSLPSAEQELYARRCGTSLGYLRKALSVDPSPKFSAELVISLERESGGVVQCEDVQPDADWPYLRATTRRQSKRRTTN